MEIHGSLPLGCYAKRLCEQRPRNGIVPRFDGDVRCPFRMAVTGNAEDQDTAQTAEYRCSRRSARQLAHGRLRTFLSGLL